jgi:polyisoprenoid-binding protein YceI
MATYDQTDAECVVYVYREGIASAVGHDLAIEVGEFEIEVPDEGGQIEGGQIEGRFAADSLRVRHAMVDGQPRPGKLSAKDKKKIEGNIRKAVLETKRYPVIKFRSSQVSGPASAAETGAVRVAGVLSLHGADQEISLGGQVEDGETFVCGRLEQPDFGIEPYSALFGALKVKSHVDVEIRVPFVS